MNSTQPKPKKLKNMSFDEMTFEQKIIANLRIVRKDKKEEAIIYRIVQEFINNSIKHSKAERIKIALKMSNNTIDIQLEDNGIGFEINAVQKNNGLRNITQRLEVLEAEYEWKSNNNIGTTLNFSIHEKN